MCAKYSLSCLVLILLKCTRDVAATEFISLPMYVWAITGGWLTLHTYGRLGSEGRITLDGTLQKSFHRNWTEYNPVISLRSVSGLILGFAPTHLEMALHRNNVSHWLGASLDQPWVIFYKTIVTLQSRNMANGKIDQDQDHDHSTELTNCGLVKAHVDKCRGQHLLG